MQAGANRPRRGRPRTDEAWRVEQRILDAATQVILKNGYSGTTMEQVAEAARAGKSTLYNRYATKAELFAAVVNRTGGEASPTNLPAPTGATIGERLICAGLDLADFTLTPQSIALMRATSAESDTFPEIARDSFRLGFESCALHIARALAEETSTTSLRDALPQAQRFVELALHPLYMHAFFGVDLNELRTRARHDIPEVAKYFERPN